MPSLETLETLSIEVDDSRVVEATQALNELANAAERARIAIERLGVTIVDVTTADANREIEAGARPRKRRFRL